MPKQELVVWFIYVDARAWFDHVDSPFFFCVPGKHNLMIILNQLLLYKLFLIVLINMHCFDSSREKSAQEQRQMLSSLVKLVRVWRVWMVLVLVVEREAEELVTVNTKTSVLKLTSMLMVNDLEGMSNTLEVGRLSLSESRRWRWLKMYHGF